MSKKQSQQNVPTLSPIANAMYNAQRKEITSSIITSLSFLAVGIIVTLFSVIKYFKITAAMTDPSEKIDAFAWLVIAGVGICVVAIGVVNMLKSFVSLGQLGALLKRTESHASPFQDQQLSKRVAQMNQSQAMKKAETASAEQRKQDKKKGFGLFGKKKLSSSELYDKYNPPKQQQGSSSQKMTTAPPKAKPLMEQKFDYGIHEEKELTFADEFLKKNKRDPFAQYRKELGIKEEAPKPIEHKPQFITATPSNPDSSSKSSTIQGGHGSSFEFDLSQIKPISADTQTAKKEETTDTSGKSLLSELDFGGSFGDTSSVSAQTKDAPKEQPKPKSLLSELDFGGNYGDTSSVSAQTQESPKEQPKSRSLLSELDFGGSFGDTSSVSAQTQETPKEQPKPRSLLSELDFGGSFGDNSSVSAQTQETPKEQPKPRSLLSELDFGGSFGDTSSVSAQTQETPKEQPKPRSLLSELDFGDSFGDTSSVSAQTQETPKEQPKPRSLLSELDFDGSFGDTSSVSTQIQEPTPDPLSKQDTPKAPIDDPVARRANVKMVSFLSDRSNDSFAEITGVEKISETHSVSSSSPYGVHREEDDGMFFAARSNNASFTQQATAQTHQQKPKQPIQQQRPKPQAQHTQPASQKIKSESYNLDNFAETQPKQRPKKKEVSSEICKNGTPAQRKYVEASEFDEWTCPQCGKTNQEYVGVCACGRRKPRPRKN